MLTKSLTDSWLFFKTHAIAISLIILPIVVPIEILTALYQYFILSEDFVVTAQLLPLIIYILAYPLYAVGVIYYISSAISGERIDTITLWKLGIKFWPPYLLLTVLIGLSIMLGFMLLIIPGIILIVRYAFAEFDLLLNQSTPLEAMRNSWASTKEYMWVILGGFACITVALYAPFYLVASLFDQSSIFFWILDTVSNMVYAVLGVLYTIFFFRIYDLARNKLDSNSK